MTDKKSDPNQNPDAVDDTKWGEVRDDNYGYANKQERLEKRGLEDWEMVQTMNESKVSIPLVYRYFHCVVNRCGWFNFSILGQSPRLRTPVV
jgi:hypothetical protein